MISTGQADERQQACKHFVQYTFMRRCMKYMVTTDVDEVIVPVQRSHNCSSRGRVNLVSQQLLHNAIVYTICSVYGSKP